MRGVLSVLNGSHISINGELHASHGRCIGHYTRYNIQTDHVTVGGTESCNVSIRDCDEFLGGVAQQKKEVTALNVNGTKLDGKPMVPKQNYVLSPEQELNFYGGRVYFEFQKP